MKKNGKAYWKLFISYVVIFSIPVIMGISFYFYVYHSVKEQTDSTNNQLIQIVKKDCDREITVYKNVLTQLAFNSNIQELSLVKTEFGDTYEYALYELQNEIFNLMNSSNRYGEYFKDIFIYFRNSDKIVSAYGNMELALYYQLYFAESKLSLEELRSYLEEQHYQELTSLERRDDVPPYLLMTMSNMKGSLGVRETTATIGVVLDTDGLSQSIEAAVWEEGVIPLLVNSDNQVLNQSKEHVKSLKLKYDDLENGENQNIIWNGQTYFAQVLESDLAEWKYVLLMPMSIIKGLTDKIKYIFMIEIFVCLLAGIGAAYQMMKINYNPLKVLLEMFQKHKGTEENDGIGNNEYMYLSQKAKSLMQEHEDYKHMIDRDKSIVKQYYLIQLLEKSYEEKDIIKTKSMFADALMHGKNMVLVFSVLVEKKENAVEEDKDEINSLRKFIVNNVFSEGIGELFKIEVVELGESVAMIVNMPIEGEAYEQLLREQVDSNQKFIRENFNFQVNVAAGGIYEGIADIHTSYMEAKEAEEFIALLEPDYITYGEIRNVQNMQYAYPLEKEEKILMAIKSHNENMASSYVNKVLEINCRESSISPFMFKCLLYDLMGTIMKGAQENGHDEALEDLLETNLFSNKQSLEELIGTFAKLLHVICAEGTGVNAVDGEAGKEFSNRILEYIKENYRDPDLNISQTGLYFHMTPAYLSSIFKKQTGESLLKVINEIRMQEAERLLMSGLSVVEVAEQVGFREPSTFIRAFKKTTGVTPGQIKGK